jgi:hypothetical protein
LEFLAIRVWKRKKNILQSNFLAFAFGQLWQIMMLCWFPVFFLIFFVCGVFLFSVFLVFCSFCFLLFVFGCNGAVASRMRRKSFELPETERAKKIGRKDPGPR